MVEGDYEHRLGRPSLPQREILPRKGEEEENVLLWNHNGGIEAVVAVSEQALCGRSSGDSMPHVKHNHILPVQPDGIAVLAIKVGRGSLIDRSWGQVS